jgi:hypothetical protein
MLGLLCTALQWCGRNDIKIGPVMARVECVRTYISAFDHTCA